jgi:ubiquitin-protein ligase
MLTEWKAPNDDDNCPYKGGTFLLTCDLPVGYPRDPPEVRFVTFIMHPNVRVSVLCYHALLFPMY